MQKKSKILAKKTIFINELVISNFIPLGPCTFCVKSCTLINTAGTYFYSLSIQCALRIPDSFKARVIDVDGRS